ncbi:MAG: ATP-binding cassette domain-containing protein [Gemmatimonadota bacterium]
MSVHGGGAPVIQARGLLKSYGGDPVVAGIDFEVLPGECVGFLGPNGAGKTTTIHMIACFVRVDAGQLLVFDLEPARAARAIKRRLGVLPQEDSLDPDLTVRKNLTVYARYFDIGRSTAASRAEELLRFVQLEERADETIRNLSGGMRRRLSLARALVSRPELLILDEPTTGLDPQARHLVWQKLRGLRQGGVTMLLTTHYMEEAAQLCDRLLVLDRGRILARGTPRQLIEEHVGREVIEIHAAGPLPADVLARLVALSDRLERAGDEVYLYFRDGRSPAAVLPLLERLAFTQRPATLEDVFLRLTGRELRD